MDKRTTMITIIVQLGCWSSILWLLLQTSPAQANALLQTSTPQPFLDSIYYGKEDVWQVFDHDLPCASVCEDDNDDVLHHNASCCVAGLPDRATCWPV